MARTQAKRGYATDVVGRLLEVLKVIPHTGKIAPRQVFERLAALGFDVDYRTIQRDLERLEGRYLERDTRSTPHGWRWIDSESKKILGLPIKAALALKLAYEHVKPLMPASLAKELKALADSAEESLAASVGRNPFAKWPDKIRVVQSGPPRTPPNVKPGVHEAVCDALLQNRQLRVRYRAATREQAREFVVTPLGMVSKDGKIYVVVSREDRPEPAHFVLHRFLEAEVIPLEGKPPTGWKGLDAAINAGKFLFPPGEVKRNQWMTLRVSELFARELEEIPISAEQTIGKEGALKAGGQITYAVRAKVDISWELVQWLLRYGNAVEVCGPLFLRERMKRVIHALYSSYM